MGSLPPGCKPEELRHLFTSYGNVVECDIMNRCGFVHLETVEMADAAIAALNGVEFKGQNIVVEPGRLKDRRGGGGGGGGGNAGGGGGAGSNRRPNMQGKYGVPLSERTEIKSFVFIRQQLQSWRSSQWQF